MSIHYDMIPAAQAAAGRILARYGLSLTRSGIEDELEILLTSVYFDLPVEDRKVVVRSLSLLGLDAVVESLRGARTPVEGTTYSCDTLGTVVVSPCRNGCCRYHLDSKPEQLNCLMVASDRAPLEPDEISDIFNKEPEDVQDTLLSAIRKMRQATVGVAKDKAELQEHFVFLRNPKVCGNCEGYIEGQPFYVEQGVSFCSPECCTTRLTSHVVIESRTGIPADCVIQWATRSFDTIEAAAQALQFPPSVLLAAVGR